MSELRSSLTEFLQINRDSASDPQVLWETTKCFIRGKCIRFSSFIKKQRESRKFELDKQIDLLEKELKDNFFETKAKEVTVLKSELKSIYLHRAEFIIHHTRQSYYFHGERSSQLLALRLKDSESKTSISAIRHEGSVYSQPKDVNRVFVNYYQHLYTSESNSDPTNFDLFLKHLNLPKLNDSQRNILDSPLTIEELKSALNCMSSNKAPGLDGIPPELLKTLWDIIAPLILNSLNFALEKGALPRDQTTALITLLLKKGKDPLECSSYRPISLLSRDSKLLAKVLALRLDRCIGDLITYDQSGFLRGRFAADNIRRLLHIIQQADSYTASSAILSLDAEKAFNRIDWSFFWSVLEHFEFGSFFLQAVKTIYSECSARVITGSSISPSFYLGRGTRQGCPLSPLLFNLSLEPLAQAFRQCSAIAPISCMNTSHKISLYADDVLLYISNITDSVKECLKLFDNFGKLSGYKINWNKSLLMPLNLAAKSEIQNLPTTIPVSDQFNYLGIRVFPSLSRISKWNYQSLLDKIKSDLLCWSPLCLALHGRIATVKMNILPRLSFFIFSVTFDTTYWLF